MKTAGMTYIAYRRFYATQFLSRATVEGDTAVVRTWWPAAFLRSSGLEVPMVIRSSEIDSVLVTRGLADHVILLPTAHSRLLPLRVSRWVGEALVPALVANAQEIGFWDGQSVVRGAEPPAS